MNFSTIRSLFVDSAPVIYFVENHPTYIQVLAPIFTLIDSNKIQIVSSPITLAECLLQPLKSNNHRVAQQFEALMLSKPNSSFVATNPEIAKRAAEIRVRYGMKLPDAIQVATALFANCDALLTNDASFKRVNEVDIIIVDEIMN